MEECFLNFLSNIYAFFKEKAPKLKDFLCFIAYIAGVLLIAADILFIFSYFDIVSNCKESIAEWASFIVALFGVSYAFKQYKNHIKEEKRKVLCDYNQRYSSDKNIESVIIWMLQVARTKEKTGEIIGVDNNIKCVSPGIHKKEMFMRFFEELNLRLDKEDMNTDEVYDLFAYYALKFDQYKEFRLDVKDYKNSLELEGTHEWDQKDFKDYWCGFRDFIDKMKDEDNKRKNSSKKK